jgi:hypothetical protein
MKVPPMGAELFSADGKTERHTDMIKLIVALRRTKTPKKLDFKLVTPCDL